MSVCGRSVAAEPFLAAAGVLSRDETYQAAKLCPRRKVLAAGAGATSAVAITRPTTDCHQPLRDRISLA